MAEQINYYKVLGVPRNASRSEIKNAYRKLAKERHPDHAGGSETDFSRLQEAHAVLSDANRRQQHDQDLDLAHAADQLAGLNFDSLDDELSEKRRERESRGSGEGSSGPSLGERLRGRFRGRGDDAGGSDDRDERRGRGSGRGRAPQRRARWYEPHELDPDPVTWKTGAFSFFGAFFAFIVVGQLGLWATAPAQADLGVMVWTTALAPFLFVVYTLTGLLAAYFAYRAAGWGGMALVFIAALVVGGSGGPEGMVQFATAGILVLLAVIYLGTRRDRR
jgi:molecular chaperone DnaJ